MERYSNQSQNTSNNQLGNGLLFAIIVAAIAGLAYSFAGNNNEAARYEGNVLPSRINQSPSENEDQKLAKNISYKSTTALSINGIKEIGMTLSFELNHFNSNGQYFLDFGDGEVKRLNGNKIEHIYTNSGIYEVNLMVEYQGKQQKIHSETLEIEYAIELAGN